MFYPTEKQIETLRREVAVRYFVGQLLLTGKTDSLADITARATDIVKQAIEIEAEIERQLKTK